MRKDCGLNDKSHLQHATRKPLARNVLNLQRAVARGVPAARGRGHHNPPTHLTRSVMSRRTARTAVSGVRGSSAHMLVRSRGYCCGVGAKRAHPRRVRAEEQRRARRTLATSTPIRPPPAHDRRGSRARCDSAGGDGQGREGKSSVGVCALAAHDARSQGPNASKPRDRCGEGGGQPRGARPHRGAVRRLCDALLLAIEK